MATEDIQANVAAKPVTRPGWRIYFGILALVMFGGWLSLEWLTRSPAQLGHVPEEDWTPVRLVDVQISAVPFLGQRVALVSVGYKYQYEGRLYSGVNIDPYRRMAFQPYPIRLQLLLDMRRAVWVNKRDPSQSMVLKRIETDVPFWAE